MEYPLAAKSLPMELIILLLFLSTSPLPSSETLYDRAQLCTLSLISGFRDQAQTMLLHTVILEEEEQARRFVEDGRRWNDGVSRIKRLVIVGDHEDEESPYQVGYETAMEVLAMEEIRGVESLEISQVRGFEPSRQRLNNQNLAHLRHLTLRRNYPTPWLFEDDFPPVDSLPFRLETLYLEHNTSLDNALDTTRLTHFTYIDCGRDASVARRLCSEMVEAPLLSHLSLPSRLFPRCFNPATRSNRRDCNLKSVTLNSISNGINDESLRQSLSIPSLEQLILYVDARNPGQRYLLNHVDSLASYAAVGGNLREIQLRSARREDLANREKWDEQVVEWEAQGVRVWFNSD